MNAIHSALSKLESLTNDDIKKQFQPGNKTRLLSLYTQYNIDKPILFSENNSKGLTLEEALSNLKKKVKELNGSKQFNYPGLVSNFEDKLEFLENFDLRQGKGKNFKTRVNALCEQYNIKLPNDLVQKEVKEISIPPQYQAPLNNIPSGEERNRVERFIRVGIYADYEEQIQLRQAKYITGQIAKISKH